MKESARYANVGSSPGLIYGGCHRIDEKAVFEELCTVVEEAIALAATSRTRCRTLRNAHA